MSIVVANQAKLKTFASAVKSGLEVSSGARSTSTYYHTKDQQIQAVRQAVEGLYDVDKSLPILLASLSDSTYFYRQEVVKNEFKKGFGSGKIKLVNESTWLQDRLQEKMLAHIIGSLPYTYALRLFMGMNDEKINATRANKFLVSWVLANMNDFSVVKYRTKMRAALKHAWHQRGYSSIMKNLKAYLANEPHDSDLLNKKVFNLCNTDNTLLAKLLLFVDGQGKAEWFTGAKYIKAYYNLINCTNDNDFYENAKVLNLANVTAIVGSKKNPYFNTLKLDGKLKKEVKAKLLASNTVITDDQKVRTKKLQEKVGGTSRKDVNYTKVATETLYKTTGIEEQKEVRAEADKISLPYRSIAIIQDVSLSNRGGKDSNDTPAVIIEHLANVLSKSAERVMVTKTSVNQTDLTRPLVDILDHQLMSEIEAIFILSDGYENFPYEGCFNDMIVKYKELNPNSTVQFIHCSPYGSAEMGAKSRELGSEIISMAVTKPSQLATQMGVRLLDFNPKKFFEDNFNKFLTFEQKVQSRVVEEMM